MYHKLYFGGNSIIIISLILVFSIITSSVEAVEIYAESADDGDENAQNAAIIPPEVSLKYEKKSSIEKTKEIQIRAVTIYSDDDDDNDLLTSNDNNDDVSILSDQLLSEDESINNEKKGRQLQNTDSSIPTSMPSESEQPTTLPAMNPSPQPSMRPFECIPWLKECDPNGLPCCKKGTSEGVCTGPPDDDKICDRCGRTGDECDTENDRCCPASPDLPAICKCFDYGLCNCCLTTPKALGGGCVNSFGINNCCEDGEECCEGYICSGTNEKAKYCIKDCAKKGQICYDNDDCCDEAPNCYPADKSGTYGKCYEKKCNKNLGDKGCDFKWDLCCEGTCIRGKCQIPCAKKGKNCKFLDCCNKSHFCYPADENGKVHKCYKKKCTKDIGDTGCNFVNNLCCKGYCIDGVCKKFRVF